MKLSLLGRTYAAIMGLLALVFFGAITANAADTGTKAPPSAAYTASVADTFKPFTFDVGLTVGVRSSGINENAAPKGTVATGGLLLATTYWMTPTFGARGLVELNINGDLSRTDNYNLGAGFTETVKSTYKTGPSVKLAALGVVNLTKNVEVGLGPSLTVERLKADVTDTVYLGGAPLSTWNGSAAATKALWGVEVTARLKDLYKVGPGSLGLQASYNWTQGTRVTSNGFDFKVKDTNTVKAGIIYTF